MHLIPTNISSPSGHNPPSNKPSPQQNPNNTSENNISYQLRAATSPTSPRYARYGNTSQYAYAAGNLLATIDFSVSDIRRWAVLDSGATGNFLVTNAPLVDKRDTYEPLTVTLPDGSRVQSTHTGLLDIPRLPRAARLGHVIPGLSTHSLVSVVTLCNAGCEVLFTKIDVTVKYRGSIVLTGKKCTRTGLWMVPLEKPTANKVTTLCNKPPKIQGVKPLESRDPSKGREGRGLSHLANNTVHTSTKAELASYYHQCLGSPPKSAILRVLRSHPDELQSFPGLTKELMKYLPPSAATAKGHMVRVLSVWGESII